MNRVRRPFTVLGVIVLLATLSAIQWTLPLPYQHHHQIRQRYPAETINCSITVSKQQNKIRKRYPAKITAPQQQNERENQLVCKPAREIVYLKTHKTGSSTLMAIFRKYATIYKLTNQVSRFPIPFYGGYPGRLRKEFSFIISDKMSPNHQKKASVLMGHFRFQEESVKEIMSPNARYISIMRNPLKASESSFQYYYEYFRQTQPPFFSRTVSCPGFPYIHVLKKVGMNFSEFLSVVSPSTILESPWGFRAKNYQSHDFGLNPYNESVEYVLAEAKKLDKTFDLVLILEHLWESLVLLKDILCMEWSDVLPETHCKKGHYTPQQFSAREQYTINQLTTQDRILYNYFNKSLWNKIEKYGRERMKNDVEKLKKMGKLTKGKSTSSNNERHGVKKTMVTFEGRAEKQSMLSDLGSRLEKEYPQGQLSTIEDKEIFYKLADYMIANNGWCPRVILA